MLRDYQEDLAQQAFRIAEQLKIVYLVMEMRVGKTLIALRTAELLGAKSVLFVTKKKAIASIQTDYDREDFDFDILVTNYEQVKKLSADYDVVVCDEAHSLGAFPKPSQRAKYLRQIVRSNYLILASGTPSPESESQLFHQFWISKNSPFEHSNFYLWAKDYVYVREVMRNGYRVNDYSNAKREAIRQILDDYILTFTQAEAGFEQSEVAEQVIEVEISDKITQFIPILLRDRYYQFKDGEQIICDSPVKLQSKIHQIFSGTVKTESGKIKYLDSSKANYIANYYIGKKVAVFYKFVGEGDMLKKAIPNWTDSPEEFNNSSDKTFICQILAGSMGTNLSTADVLIFYNIDFSSLQYWQARARLSALDRKSQPVVHWLFAKDGIESKIYKRVLGKKDYTVQYFIDDYLRGSNGRVGFTGEDYKVFETAGLCG